MCSLEATRGVTILFLVTCACLILLYDNHTELTLVFVRSLHIQNINSKLGLSGVIGPLKTEKEPLILLYNRWSSSRDWGAEFEHIGYTSMMYLKNCSGRCRLTVDRQWYEETANLVLFAQFFIKRDPSLRKLNATV